MSISYPPFNSDPSDPEQAKWDKNMKAIEDAKRAQKRKERLKLQRHNERDRLPISKRGVIAMAAAVAFILGELMLKEKTASPDAISPAATTKQKSEKRSSEKSSAEDDAKSTLKKQ